MSLPASALVDAAARRAAQEEFARPLVLEAGAGTGKTATLVARVVVWSLGPGWERTAARLGDRDLPPDAEDLAAAVLERVVAITFTEAAAAEMAARVGEVFADVEQGRSSTGLDPACLPPAKVAADRARALLGALHRLEVRTIHAFCAGLLRRFPLEAALPPDFVVDATGARVGEIVQREVEAAMRTATDEGGLAPWERLAAAGAGPADLAAALEVLVHEAAATGLFDADPFADPALAGAAWDGLLTSARAFLALDDGRLAGCGAAKAVGRAACAALVRLVAALGAGRPDSALALWAEVAAAARTVTTSCRDRLAAWAAGTFNVTEAKAVAGDEAMLAQAAAAVLVQLEEVRTFHPFELDAARRLLAPLLARVRSRLRAAGVLTFSDLLAEAARLLADPAVAGTVRRGLDQLLVDEFQDTDRLQCEVVRRIALEGPPEERPALFVVGDPKQSIYAWRSADLTAYEAFVGEITAPAIGGRVAPLTVNFRSLPAILDEVARVVGPVMREQPGLQPRFERLDACPALAGRVPADPAVEWWASWVLDDGVVRRDGVEEANQLEARTLAADLVRLHRQGTAWREIGILLRATSDLDVYLEALRVAGVPFQVARDREYYRSREVVEAAALLRLLLDPSDELALLTMLRSDTVGVPDAALAPLWRAGLPRAVAAVPGADGAALVAVRNVVATAAVAVPPVAGLEALAGWESALLALVEDLAVLRPMARAAPPAELLEHLRALRQGDATAAARYLGGVRRGRLARFLREAESVLSSAASAAAAGRALRRAVEEERPFEAAEGAPAPADAVQVMTIHNAKGLDFTHVYLCQLHKGTGSNRAPAAALARDGGSYQLLGWPVPGWLAAATRTEEVADCERVRLLYVATTRAKERLVLMGHLAARSTSRSLSDLLTGSAPVAELTDQGADGCAVREVDGVRYVVCALADTTATAAPAAPAAIPPVTVAADAASAARARESRSWSAGAAAEAHARLERVEAGDTAPAGGGGREAAMAAGSIVHRALEDLDLNGDVRAQLAAGAEALGAAAAGAPLTDGAAAAALLDRLAVGPLAPCLARLAGSVVARELPVLLPPAADGDGPVGFVSGFVDLVYRDPDDGALVVADYKTDRVEDEAAVAARAALYAPQLQVYARALREALGLERPPRTELWFLWPGRVVRVGGKLED